MSNQENIRVLIVEDDYLVGEMIKGLLEDAGYTIVGEAGDGLEAVEMTQSLQPDVVLMDIKMPNMDGNEATRLIYERCPTPVVVLTAYETGELVENASAAGVGAYLVKPPNVREIERAITIALARFDDMMKLRDYAGQLEQRVQERTAQLTAQCARLGAILHSASDGIVVTNGQGEIIQANPVAQTWLTQTLSPEESTLLQAEVRDLARQAGAEAAPGERPKTMLELTGLDLELKASPISDPMITLPLASGGPRGVEATAVVDIHDISYLKALDRMKSRFVTNISHELRTPIATLKLTVALMQRTPPEKWGEYLDTLAQEIDWLARLVQDILQISHIDTGRLVMKPRPIPLNELAQATTADHQALAHEQGLKLECHLAEQEPAALVDPARLIQALDKLVRNAILYTPEEGKVMVATGTEEAEGRVWATVTVSDTGMGIPEEELPHIFERFFRGKKPRKMQISGTGLGLTIVKEIVELHGGQITVESPSTEFIPSEAEGHRTGEVGVGSTFTIWLPLADAEM